jgi:hypothetical protein
MLAKRMKENKKKFSLSQMRGSRIGKDKLRKICSRVRS